MVNQILYTACVTPFNNNEVDFSSFEKLLRMQEKAKNGVLLLGSTGESLSLTDAEKREIVNFVCGLNLNTEIIIGIPSHNFKAAIEWLEFCNQLPIDGYLMTTPIYTKPGIIGQTKWFETLLNLAVHPAILYNIPGRAAIRLHPEAVKNLAKHPNFMAIKDSGGTIDGLVDFQMAAPNIPIYCGDDYLMPSMGAEGAVGLISVASNAWPGAVRKYVQESIGFTKNSISSSDKVWWQACKALFTASNPIPIKALLKEIGVIKSDEVRLPLSREDLKSTKELLFYNEIISQWEESNNG